MRTVLPVHSAQVETEIPIYERSSSGERKLRSEPSSRRVKEVATNFECGISLVNFNDIQQGDILETFMEIEVNQTL